MKGYHPTHESKYPWFIISIDAQGLEVIHARLAKRKEVDNVLCAYRRLYPTRSLKAVYRPKI